MSFSQIFTCEYSISLMAITNQLLSITLIAFSCYQKMTASPDDFHGRILHQACIYNNEELLTDLLKGDEKNNINALDAAGRSVVYSAVSNNSLTCLKVLLQNGGWA